MMIKLNHDDNGGLSASSLELIDYRVTVSLGLLEVAYTLIRTVSP